MKTRFFFLLKLYAAYVVTSVFMKLVFLMYNHSATDFSFTDVLQVLRHGLIMDCSVAGYLIALPLLATMISVWLPSYKWWRPALLLYTSLIGFALSMIFVSDCALYPFWQFKLDAMALSYLDSPKSAISSVSIGYVLIGITCIIVLALAIFLIQYICVPKKLDRCKPLPTTLLLLLFGGLAFIGVRGGFGKSTMNVGTVYFSDNMFLNHAAVNPAFNLLYSSLKAKNFDKMCRFYTTEEADKIYRSAGYSTQSVNSDSLLNTMRPNIVLVVIEGFGGTFVEHLHGEKNVTPRFDSLVNEGVFFSNFYANSFRTDRGLVSILSGYPAFPELSVLHFPEKAQSLGSVGQSLAEHGYSTDFLYGGDINFKNIKGYLLSNGFQKATGDTYFPGKTRTTHAWGVTDAIAFDTLFQQIERKPQSYPWFTTFLTLASHEPWIVPFERSGLDKVANSMAYVDDCIGKFIDKLKKTPAWKNMLVIFLPDHGIGYPEGLTEADIRRCHIPMLWVGGAVKQPQVVDKICCQTDLAATLLGQMGIEHSSFTFSRDVMSKGYHPLALHTFDNGFALIDSTGYSIYDLTSSKTLSSCPRESADRITLGKAILQKNIEDFIDR